MCKSPTQQTSHDTTDMQRGSHRHSAETTTQTLACTCKAPHRQADLREPVLHSSRYDHTAPFFFAAPSTRARRQRKATASFDFPVYQSVFCECFVLRVLLFSNRNGETYKQCENLDDFPQSTKVFLSRSSALILVFFRFSRATKARDAFFFLKKKENSDVSRNNTGGRVLPRHQMISFFRCSI